MSSNDEPDIIPLRSPLQASAKKNWSLTDSKKDEEVLQEMGVRVLDSDEAESQGDVENHILIKSGSKRKFDLENVNPNADEAQVSPWTSPRKSPRKILNAIAGTSYDNIPHTLESMKTTFCNQDEETPESDFKVPNWHNVYFTPKNKIWKADTEPPRVKRAPLYNGIDAFDVLSDEMMLSVFKWLPKRTLATCMCVCSRWERLASDETFWQRLDLGNRVIREDGLGKILNRKPIVVRLAGSEIGRWIPRGPLTQSRIQYLDLSMCSIDVYTLTHLLDRCHGLRKLSVENVAINTEACVAIGKCSKLETLNLTMATGVTTDGLRAILQGCLGIHSLNISWCNLDADSLTLLGEMLPPRLLRLNLAGARIMDDQMLSEIVHRCKYLVELDVSDCGHIRGESIKDIMKVLQRLEHLALSRCYLLPPWVLTKLFMLPSLQYLEVWGMLQDTSLSALRAALRTIKINQFMHSAIARPTVGARRTSIWGLRTKD